MTEEQLHADVVAELFWGPEGRQRGEQLVADVVEAARGRFERLHLRTTNPIERLNKEFKRRTNAMEVTGGEISTYRCLAYVAQTMEYRWSFHPLSQWSTVYTLNAA